MACCTWTDEEAAELDRLYEEQTLRRSPSALTLCWSRRASEGCHAQTWHALKVAARGYVAA